MDTEIKINFNEKEQAEKILIKKIFQHRFKENLSFREISVKIIW